ncbi:serine-rich protein [Trifolium repens]|nr:serine-rich protein [Trifolium repens]
MAFPSSRNETSSYTHSYSSAFASSSVTNFTPRASPVIMQSSNSSTANVKLHSHRNSPRSPPSPSSTVRFSVEQRPESMTVTKDSRNNNAVSSSSTTEKPPRKCMCSPTTHAGSFRCAYHKRMADQEQQRQQKQEQVQQRQQKEEQIQKQQQQRLQTAWSRSRTLNLRRSAMKNSLVRIGVEGEMMKITLTNLIRPLSHLLRRREAFQPKPSRLSVMSKA